MIMFTLKDMQTVTETQTESKVRRIRDGNGRVIRLEMNDVAAAEIFGISIAELKQWAEVIPPHKGSVYIFENQEQVGLYRQRAAVMNTRVSAALVKDLEARNLLAAYAGLAEDCPKGLNVLQWRSYAIIVLLQNKGHKIDALELAQRCQLTYKDERGKLQANVAEAEEHIRLLIGLEFLKEAKDKKGRPRWGHKGLPKSMRGDN
jgi:hypothetical protein